MENETNTNNIENEINDNNSEPIINPWQPEEKPFYIGLMKDIQSTTSEIMKVMSSGVAIVNNKLLTDIKKKSNKNDVYLEKLQKDWFEIAIVGLEKAGKSTFVNALIQNNLMPTRPSRCTYTSTQLMAGDEDEATVEFYTTNEFNEIFHDMLRTIEYPDADKINFDMMSLNNFTTYFKGLETTNKMLYNLCLSSLEADFRMIITGKAKIVEYLNKENLIFKGKELESEELKLFITDPVQSRAVKKINVKSTKLNDLKNCIFYDVPGFDSPTKLHEDQTIARLKSADAIILVRNLATNPSILGTELKILRKNTDDDNIPLKDKLFVFGNRIDSVNSIDDARSNITTLANDVRQNQLASKKGRVVVGSALAYLQSKKCVEGTESMEKIKAFSLPQGDGIDIIKSFLIEYYKTDRFNILKQRIISNIADFKKSFEEIIKENSEGAKIEYAEQKDNELVINLIGSSRENLKTELKSLRRNLMNEILENKYFTVKLKGMISKKFNPIKIDEIHDAITDVSQSGSNEFPVEKVNDAIRNRLQAQFRNDFTKMIIELAGEKINKINVDVLEIFLKSLAIEKAKNSNYIKLREATQKELIDILCNDNKNDEKSFTHLIERFSRCLLDILILYPLTSQGRIEKFKKTEKSLFSLALYHDVNNPTLPSIVQPMIEMVLSHRINVKKQITSVKPVDPKSQDPKTPQKIEEIDVANYNVTLDYSNSLYQKYIDTLSKTSDKKVEFNKDKYLEDLRTGINAPSTQEEVLAEINKDIDYLTILLKTSVLEAINLEEAFNATMTNNIDNLISGITNKKAGDGPLTLLESFINRHYSEIKAEEFERIAGEKALTENRKKIVGQLLEILKKIDEQKS